MTKALADKFGLFQIQFDDLGAGTTSGKFGIFTLI